MSTAILLIHGFLTGPDDWDGLIPLLSGRYDEIATLCQPGHARADEKDKLNYKQFTHPASYAGLTESLDRLFAEHDSVDLVGHSMGAAMAVWAAAHYPIGRISLLAPAFRFPRVGIFIKNMFYRSKRKKFRKMKMSDRYAQALTAENDRYFNDYKAGQEILFSRLIPYWTPHNIAVLYKNVKKGQKEIKKVSCPVQVIWGSFDEFVPASAIKGFMKRLVCDDLTFVNYGNLGHSMMLSMSKEIVFRDVLAFLNGSSVENITPENPGEERLVKRILVVDAGAEKYKRIKTYQTGSRFIVGSVEIIEERSSKVIPF